MYYLLNLITLSVKKIIIEKNTGKMRKNTGKVREFCQCGKVGTMEKFLTTFHISMQACRGRKYDWGVEVADEDSTDAGLENLAVRKIPIEADLLLAYSVVPGTHYSMTDFKN